MCNVNEEIRELARMAMAAMDSEPVAVVEPVFFIEVEGDDWINAGRIPSSTFDFNNLPDGINKLYVAPQPAPVVQMVSEEPPEHLLPKGNSRDAAYRRGATILGWKLCRAAMLQAEPVATANKLGNSPVIPAGLIAAVNRLLDSDGSRGCYSAIRCGNAHDEIERLLVAAPQEVKGE